MNLCPAKPSPPAGQQPAPPTLPRIACCTKSSVCLPCAVVQTVNLAGLKLLYCGFPGKKSSHCLLTAREDGLAVTVSAQGTSWLWPFACQGISLHLTPRSSRGLITFLTHSSTDCPCPQGCMCKFHWGVDAIWISRAEEAGRSPCLFGVTDEEPSRQWPHG